MNEITFNEIPDTAPHLTSALENVTGILHTIGNFSPNEQPITIKTVITEIKTLLEREIVTANVVSMAIRKLKGSWEAMTRALKKFQHIESRSDFALRIHSNLVQLKLDLLEIHFAFDVVEKHQTLATIEQKIEYLENNLILSNQSITKILNDYPGLEKNVSEELEKSGKKYNEFEKFVLERSANVKKLFALSSTESVEKIFKLRSGQESDTANFYRNAATALMTVSSLVATIFLMKGLVFEFSSVDAISVVAMSLILLTPAIYLSKESTKHRKFEQDNMKVSQNIEAILSFIVNLKDEKQSEVMELIAQALLQNMNPSNLDDSAPNVQLMVLEKLIEKLKPQ